MTDSPSVHLPSDPREQSILNNLLELRDDLSLLKQNRSTYIRADDVVKSYDILIKQVHVLNDVRKESGKPQEQNRLDTVLEDCFQLISLAFMTIGRNNEAPATYSLSSTMKRLLDHLVEAGFYSYKDLNSMEAQIQVMRGSVQRGQEVYSPDLIDLLSARLDYCTTVLNDLKARIPKLCQVLSPEWEKLVSILRSLAAANTRSCFPEAEVKSLEQELFKFRDGLKEGKFVHADGTVPENQDIVISLLQKCLLWAQLVQEKRGKIDPRFSDMYEKLREIRNQLEKLELTRSWSMREIDLYGYQRQLDRIDESRIDGNFLDAEGNPADLHSQRTLLYLIRRSYAYIWHLLIASEPVSEALLPIYNQLQTLRRCLVEVQKSGGVSSPRELYPYSMKLNSIDNLRVDGKFMVGNDIPEGQGSINSLLAECFDISYDMRVQAESHSGTDTPTNQEVVPEVIPEVAASA